MALTGFAQHGLFIRLDPEQRTGKWEAQVIVEVHAKAQMERISYHERLTSYATREEALAAGREFGRRMVENFTVPAYGGGDYREPAQAATASQEAREAQVGKGLVIPEVLATLDFLDDGPFTVAPDLLAAVKADPAVWKNCRRLPPAYVRIRAGFTEGARNRPAEFAKRLRYFQRMTAQDRRFGFGGIEKHYGES